jgi:hypothetical protein
VSETEIMETAATETATQTTQEPGRSYTQEEFDKHMAGMRKSLEAKYERQFSELGDLDELKQLKATAEKQRTEEALKKGEFEKILQEMAQKKDAEISKRDEVIREYRVNTPLLDAAARYRAVAPEQIQMLLAGKVKLNDAGEVEVLDGSGTVRYDDSGKLFSVDNLVKEFLDTNPHFVAPGAATTNTQSSVSAASGKTDVDINDLDLTRPEHRKIYKEARAKGLI